MCLLPRKGNKIIQDFVWLKNSAPKGIYNCHQSGGAILNKILQFSVSKFSLGSGNGEREIIFPALLNEIINKEIVELIYNTRDGLIIAFQIQN